MLHYKVTNISIPHLFGKLTTHDIA